LTAATGRETFPLFPYWDRADQSVKEERGGAGRPDQIAKDCEFASLRLFELLPGAVRDGIYARGRDSKNRGQAHPGGEQVLPSPTRLSDACGDPKRLREAALSALAEVFWRSVEGLREIKREQQVEGYRGESAVCQRKRANAARMVVHGQ